MAATQVAVGSGAAWVAQEVKSSVAAPAAASKVARAAAWAAARAAARARLRAVEQVASWAALMEETRVAATEARKATEEAAAAVRVAKEATDAVTALVSVSVVVSAWTVAVRQTSVSVRPPSAAAARVPSAAAALLEVAVATAERAPAARLAMARRVEGAGTVQTPSPIADVGTVTVVAMVKAVRIDSARLTSLRVASFARQEVVGTSIVVANAPTTPPVSDAVAAGAAAFHRPPPSLSDASTRQGTSWHRILWRLQG